MEKSYPNPFEQKPNNNYKFRDMTIRQQHQQPNFKVIDDSSFQRSDIPMYHTLPLKETHLPPFTHAMKRTANENNVQKYNDIFGENRSFNVNYLQEQDTSKRKQEQQYYYKPDDNAPRMKILGDINQGEEVSNGESERRKVYNAIIEYFPGFELIKTGNYNGYGVYKAIVKCLICTGVRYIVAIVKNDPYGVGTIRPLSLLKWEAFQTRFAEDDKDFQQFVFDSFSYSRPSNSILEDKIRVVARSKTSQTYECNNLPLQVEILKTNEYEDLADFGTVSSALELFQTVISFSR
jgi:hypothetical protein